MKGSRTHLLIVILLKLVEVVVDSEDVLSFLQRGVRVSDFVLLLGGDGLPLLVYNEVVRI